MQYTRHEIYRVEYSQSASLDLVYLPCKLSTLFMNFHFCAFEFIEFFPYCCLNRRK